MNTRQAKEFIAKFPNAVSYVKESHLEDLSPLFEVHIECLKVRKDEFHFMYPATYMPRKETLDKFAGAAGISYNKAVEASTRKDGEHVYVGQSQAMEMGPDGKMRYGDICEYEFDVDVRHEEIVLNDRESKYPKLHDSGVLVESKSRRAWLELKKVARQRANTGARSRATLNLLGMSTGLKDLFKKDDPDSTTREFLFSRVIVNTRNEMVLNRALDSMFGQAGNVPQLFGPDADVPRIAERNVSPSHDEADPVPDDLDDAPFDLEPESVAPVDPEEKEKEVLRDDLKGSLESGLLPPAKEDQVRGWLSDESLSLSELRENSALVTAYIDSRKKKQGVA